MRKIKNVMVTAFVFMLGLCGLAQTASGVETQKTVKAGTTPALGKHEQLSKSGKIDKLDPQAKVKFDNLNKGSKVKVEKLETKKPLTK